MFAIFPELFRNLTVKTCSPPKLFYPITIRNCSILSQDTRNAEELETALKRIEYNILEHHPSACLNPQLKLNVQE